MFEFGVCAWLAPLVEEPATLETQRPQPLTNAARIRHVARTGPRSSQSWGPQDMAQRRRISRSRRVEPSSTTRPHGQSWL